MGGKLVIKRNIPSLYEVRQSTTCCCVQSHWTLTPSTAKNFSLHTTPADTDIRLADRILCNNVHHSVDCGIDKCAGPGPWALIPFTFTLHYWPSIQLHCELQCALLILHGEQLSTSYSSRFRANNKHRHPWVLYYSVARREWMKLRQKRGAQAAHLKYTHYAYICTSCQ